MWLSLFRAGAQKTQVSSLGCLHLKSIFKSSPEEGCSLTVVVVQTSDILTGRIQGSDAKG